LALLKRAPLIAAITAAAIVVLLVAAWVLDMRAHDGEALRNVTVAGHDVGGKGGDALAEAIGEITVEEYGEAVVTVETPDDEIELPLSEIGFDVDVAATAAGAVDTGRNPFSWLLGLVSEHEAGVVATVDRDLVRELLVAEEPTIEPGITGASGEILLIEGKEGTGIDADEVADGIEAALAEGATDLTVAAEPVTIQPRFTEDDARALADEAEELTSRPLSVIAGETEADIPGSTVRTWVRSEPGEDGLELSLDGEAVLTDLAELLAAAKTEPSEARFTVEGGRPVILGGEPGQACCALTSVVAVLGAVKAGHGGPVRLPLTTVEPESSREELEALNIVEEIASFTTRHACCESRVTNIHRIADLVRGVVVRPGATFSINDHVGRRTTENGFVEGGVIQNGVFETSVGGGISQFATTLFNAAFFGGLDFVEYQSHSIYISRYPYGREATLSYPKPDLIIENSTPHGVLIWPTYNDTSITVTLYSTEFANGEQTGQTESPVGQAGCKRVTTTRTRTYVDGREPVVDSVRALYRPAEGVQCDGPPPTTTTTAAPAPPPPPEETTTTTAAPPG